MLSHGEAIYGPAWAEEDIGPINEVLTRLGVSKKPDKLDAFETAGLDTYRSNEYFRERATPITASSR